MKKILFVIALLVVSSQSIQAQLTTKTHTVTLSINNILELDFDNTTQVLGFTFANAADFESGLFTRDVYQDQGGHYPSRHGDRVRSSDA